MVATFTLLFDIPAFMDAITGTEGGIDDPLSTAPSDTVSPSSERAARVAQVVRIVRLIRVVKLYKIYIQRRQARAAKAGGLDDGAEDGVPAAQRQMRVGEKLTELTIRKVGRGLRLRLAQAGAGQGRPGPLAASRRLRSCQPPTWIGRQAWALL